MKNFNQSEYDQSLVQAPAMQLCMVVRDDLVPLFFRLLSQGVFIFIQAGSSIKELLCGQLGIQEEYLDERIKTIFLNSKAVDDVDSTIVESESTLALSGPMPGLAGATFRRGGFFSGMRSQISYDKSLSAAPKNAGKICLKLFNLVVKELGPTFLERGVWLKRKQIQDFILENADQLTNGCISAKLDGQDIESKELSNIDFTDKPVFLQIKIK
ncbi:MAG: hypothetical protein PVG87_27250 [Desulfobacteraceae bacterium]|jgi:hypothetical protein